jgi:hypothetical protein
MSATLRNSTIRQRRQRREKRNKLRSRLAHASAAERQGLEARLQKTYQFLTAEQDAKPRAAAKPAAG